MTNTRFLIDLQLPINPIELLNIEARAPCPKCSKTARWVCLECGVPVNIPNIPVPSAPCRIDALFYRFGNIKKSSLELLAPLGIPNFGFSEFDPDLAFDEENTFLLFPSPEAVGVEQISSLENARFVVLDCSWPQARKCIASLALSKLKTVKIRAHQTAFWRPHGRGNGSECLSSAECVYWLCSELQEELNRRTGISADLSKYDVILTLYAAEALLVKRELFRRNRSAVAIGRKGELQYEDWEQCERELNQKYAKNEDSIK